MKESEHLSAGIFIFVALLLLGGAILLIGQERQIFASQTEFYATFKDVQGLTEGAPVRLGGISIGRVSNIGFSQDPKDLNVHTTLLVNSKYLERIRRDTTVSILTQGLLGDKYMSMTSGSADNILPPGSEMKTEEPGDIAEVLDKAGKVVDTTVEISENVNTFLKDFREKTLDEFTRAVSTFADVANEIKIGKGLLHRVVYSDKEGKEILRSMDRASQNLSEITQKVRAGDGMLHALIYDKKGEESVSAVTAAAQNLAETANHINDIASQIKEGQGLLHGLVYDKSPEGIPELMEKLNKTAQNLEEASQALASGSGTIGALLVDSALYDNLVEVTEGAKRSIILRHAIRRTLAKN